MAEYEERIEAARRRKEEYFAEHPRSPIPESHREEFPGLSYFPVRPEYRFVLDLHEHGEVETVVVETTMEGEREYRRRGEFRFEVDGEACTLQAYEAAGDDGLWIPFRDGTSGEETYGAGRYIDLDPEEDRTDEGWVLDFNEAYNPTCAYNQAYECPLVPMENWLDVRIEAGEKDFPGEAVEPRGHDHE